MGWMSFPSQFHSIHFSIHPICALISNSKGPLAFISEATPLAFFLFEKTRMLLILYWSFGQSFHLFATFSQKKISKKLNEHH
jgi:hypothetical protein